MVYIIHGEGISISNLHKFFDNSFKPSADQDEEIDGFMRDHSLSDNKAQVYHNPITNQAIVNHRGTKGKLDWLNNLSYHAGLYEYTPRYKHGKKIQEQAEQKYGANNINTIGYSQGGILSKKLGSNTESTIMFNRPVSLKDSLTNSVNPAKNQYDIRTSADPISIFQRFERKANKDLIIPSGSFSPFTNHSTDNLKKLDQIKMIGGKIELRRRKIYNRC